MADRRKLRGDQRREEKVQLPQFGRDAQIRAQSFDADSNTIEIVWTTGASVRRYDWWDGTEYDEVLSVDPKAVRLDRLNLGAPFLNSHCSYGLENVIGCVAPGSAKIAEGEGTCRVQLSRAPGDADIVQKIKDGVIRNVSVGYWIHKVVKTEADDKTVARWDVVDWEPLEISAVPIPADPGSQIRSQETSQDDKGGPALRSCVVVSAHQPSSAPEKGRKEAPMSTARNRTVAPKNAKEATKRLAELEAEKKRLMEMMRDGDSKDEDADDERDGDDEDDKKDEKDSDDERAGDGDEKKDEDEESDDERDGDADEEDECEDKDDERAGKGKRAMTQAEVRKAAEAAVRADRIRGAKIREIATQFGFPKLGERHAAAETSVRVFKDLVLDKLAERQKKRGNTTFAAAGTAELDESRAGRNTPAAARDYDKGAAEARALLGK